jgi:hypothetical protein
MADSVLSHVNQELTDSVVAGLNSQDEGQHVPGSSASVASSSGVVSDLATIVEAVTLGDTSEEETSAPQTPKPEDPIATISQHAPPPQPSASGSGLSVVKQVGFSSSLASRKLKMVD